MPGFQPPDVPAEAFVKEVDHGSHARHMAAALVGEQPQDPAVVRPRRHAADKVRVGVGGNARKDGDPEARTHPRQ